MAEALIAALLRRKVYKASEIGVSEPDPERRKNLAKRYRTPLFPTNAALVAACPTLLLAVKPQQMSEVLSEVRDTLRPSQLVISIAAGLDSQFFYERLGRGLRFIRVMPNVCAMVGAGASALYAGAGVRPADRKSALQIFEAAGKALFVEKEDLLDTVTAVSGSGPAFAFLFMEAILEEAEKLGLDRAAARMLLSQTLTGSALLASQSPESLPALIGRVTSKGGTTEAGLSVLEARGFREALSGAIRAAALRAIELRKQAGTS